MPTKPAPGDVSLQSGDPADNLVLAALFNEGSGTTVHDYGPPGNDFTFGSGNPTWSPGGAYGGPSAALTGGGDNRGLASDAGLPAGGADWTMLFGFKTTHSGPYVTLYSGGTQGTGTRRNVYLNGGSIAFDGWGMVVQGAVPVADGADHVAAIWYDGTLHKLFLAVDGTTDVDSGASPYVLDYTSLGQQCLGNEVDLAVVRPYTDTLNFWLIYAGVLTAPQRAARVADPFLDLAAAAAAGGRRPPALWLGSFRRPLPRRAARRPGFR